MKISKDLDLKKLKPRKQTYWLTRFIFLRGMGFVYFFAFISAAMQVLPLLGTKGLLPINLFVERIAGDSLLQTFMNNPSLFILTQSDTLLVLFAWIGTVLSLVVLLGFANSIIMFILWFLYLSYVNIGQLFYGFGWEIQLCEIGFLAIFMVPLLDWRPFPKRETPLPFIWLIRWFLFRFYLGSGLIKLRGSECWQDFTCLYYHFETQPIPNPLSPFMHFLPQFILKFGVMFTEFLQVFSAFFVFYPRVLRITAGLIFFSFQSILIVTGNYAFFNWITLVPALFLLDDRLLKLVLPKKLVTAAHRAEQNKLPFTKPQNNFHFIVFGILVWLSIPVVVNLVSENQVMNTSYNRWNLVNTYGAFGYIGKERYELVVAGTRDEVISDDTQWKEYEFIAKPTDIDRGLPLIAPYQPRLDWQIWFAAQSTSSRHGWLIHLIWKFLHNDEGALGLIAFNPFPDKPPTFIKIDRYDYNFEKPFSDHTWQRSYINSWLGPVHVNNPSLIKFIDNNRWENYRQEWGQSKVPE
jgi:hypothetical protein